MLREPRVIGGQHIIEFVAELPGVRAFDLALFAKASVGYLLDDFFKMSQGVPI